MENADGTKVVLRPGAAGHVSEAKMHRILKTANDPHGEGWFQSTTACEWQWCYHQCWHVLRKCAQFVLNEISSSACLLAIGNGLMSTRFPIGFGGTEQHRRFMARGQMDMRERKKENEE